MGINQIARETGTSKLYYLFNGHADVVGMADATGTVVNSYSYDIYGNIISANEAGGTNPIRYAGQYYDNESEMYYLRARYYDPELMRFISEDSYKGDVKDPLSLNLYTYCEGNPIIYFDPSGQYKQIGKNDDTGITTTSAGGVDPFTLTDGLIRMIRTARNAKRVLRVIRTIEDLSYTVRCNPDSYYSYKDLKSLIDSYGLGGKGIGLEAHHLLEKQFADVFNVKKDDIISVALTPLWHRSVNGEKILLNGSNIDALIKAELKSIIQKSGKEIVGKEEIWAAHRNVYINIGHED